MLGCLITGMGSEALSVCFYLVFALLIIYDFPDAVDGICSNNTKYLSTPKKLNKTRCFNAAGVVWDL